MFKTSCSTMSRCKTSYSKTSRSETFCTKVSWSKMCLAVKRLAVKRLAINRLKVRCLQKKPLRALGYNPILARIRSYIFLKPISSPLGRNWPNPDIYSKRKHQRPYRGKVYTLNIALIKNSILVPKHNSAKFWPKNVTLFFYPFPGTSRFDTLTFLPSQ